MKIQTSKTVANPPSDREMRDAGLVREPFVWRHPGRDLRLKVLGLVVLSALVPVVVVGVASYLTARQIVTDKLENELSGRAAAGVYRIRAYVESRLSDAEIFAGSSMVSENLESSAAAEEVADERIRRYLEQVRARYPLYSALIVYDLGGRVVGQVGAGAEELRAGQMLGRDRDVLLAGAAPEPLLLVRRSIRVGEDREIGTLVTVSGLDELWLKLAGESGASSGLRVIGADGALLFDNRREPPQPAGGSPTDGVRLCLAGEPGIATYSDETGEPVVGAYRFIADYGIGVLEEIEVARAFAASDRLRNFTWFVGLLTTVLVAGLGVWLVLGLSRPVEALTAGAAAVAEGDLSHRIAVTSNDQIGYLSRVFNQMIERLEESQSGLERLSKTDDLTGLGNRRHLSRMFRAELNRARRAASAMSVLMIDLDLFKAYNDRFGHLRGDELLRATGRFLSRQLRPTDVAARYGGEEFVVILPGLHKQEAVRLADRLRATFFDARLAEGPFSLSVGIATYPEDGESEEALIQAADAALYGAKRAGRNRVRAA